MNSRFTLMDGAMGTELVDRGVAASDECWTAMANIDHSETVSAIHRDYAIAGATIHTANTFRTKSRNVGERWRELTTAAVRLARESVPSQHLVAGSIAPLDDCYRPDLSKGNEGPEHHEMAQHLVDAGCDLLLCETFANRNEAIIAAQCCLATQTPTWVALTAGPNGDLLSPAELVQASIELVDLGVDAILINCVDAGLTNQFLAEMSLTSQYHPWAKRNHPKTKNDDLFGTLGVPVGVYANAVDAERCVTWKDRHQEFAIESHVDRMLSWIAGGATILGGCCGTSPAYTRAMASQLHRIERTH